MFSVGLIPIGISMWGRWWIALVVCWVRSRSQRREPGMSVWSPGSGRRAIWFGSGLRAPAATAPDWPGIWLPLVSRWWR